MLFADSVEALLCNGMFNVRPDWQRRIKQPLNLSDGNAMFLAFLAIGLIPVEPGNYLIHGTILYIRIYIVKAADHL